MTPRVRRNLGWAYFIAGPVLATVVLIVGCLVASRSGGQVQQQTEARPSPQARPGLHIYRRQHDRE